MKAWLAVVDRTAVLFLGLAAGVAIGLSFRDEAPSGAPAPLPLPAPAAAPAPGAVPGTPAPTTATPTAPAAAAPAAMPEVAAVATGIAPPGAQLARTVAEGRTIRIGVFGDSFGDGVWSGLNRQLTRKAGYEVVKYSQQATGFTRYKSLNLENRAAEELGDTPLDIAVISYGANDTQGIIAPGGKLAKLMSPAWQAEIGARVDRYVALLRRHGAMVYWVGLPRMRKASFDGDIQAMNAFYTQRMAALGVPFIDTRPAASDAAGQYAAYLPDPKDGHQVLMRADDGIHMSMNGYVWITRTLAGRIRAYVDAARQMGGGAPAPAPAPPPPLAAAPVLVAPPRPAAPKPAAPKLATPKPVPSAAPKPAPRVDPPLRDEPAKPKAADKPPRDPSRKLPDIDLSLTPADLGEKEPPR